MPPLSRFRAITSSPWLVEHYALETGPNNTLVGRRLDAPRATDEQILANFEKAVEREPLSCALQTQRMR